MSVSDNYKQVLKKYAYRIIDIATQRESEFFRFCYTNRLHCVIMLLICSDENYTYEILCKRLSSLGSRSSIKNVLDMAVGKKFLIKKKLITDKRQQVYVLSEEYIGEVKNLAKKLKENY
tara:strand:+ start:145 stop:501 length:357 start_codon:yes stop_codon:yes gene_type:complete